MSASASVYPLALSSPCGIRGADLALPAPPPFGAASGWAEAQRLEHGPRLQGNGLVGRHPLRSLPLPEGTLLAAQQEFGSASCAGSNTLTCDLSSGKTTR